MDGWWRVAAEMIAGFFGLGIVWFGWFLNRKLNELARPIVGTYNAVNSGRMERIEANVKDTKDDVHETMGRVREIGENMAAGRERFAAHDKRLERIENILDRTPT